MNPFQLFSSIKTLLSPSELKNSIYVLILVLFLGIFETIGVASLMPFLAILGNPEMVNENTVLNYIYKIYVKLEFAEEKFFLFFLGTMSFIFIFISAVYRTIAFFILNHYIEMKRHSIGLRQLEYYLNQKYEFYLNVNI